jgi:hypothetical protein
MAAISNGRDLFDDTKSAADQLQHYGLDGDVAFKAVEMWLMDAPIRDLRAALTSATPSKSINQLFNREFAQWRQFANDNDVPQGRITAITAPRFAAMARIASSQKCWIFERPTATTTATTATQKRMVPKRLANAKRERETSAAMTRH